MPKEFLARNAHTLSFYESLQRFARKREKAYNVRIAVDRASAFAVAGTIRHLTNKLYGHLHSQELTLVARTYIGHISYIVFEIRTALFQIHDMVGTALGIGRSREIIFCLFIDYVYHITNEFFRSNPQDIGGDLEYPIVDLSFVDGLSEGYKTKLCIEFEKGSESILNIVDSLEIDLDEYMWMPSIKPKNRH